MFKQNASNTSYADASGLASDAEIQWRYTPENTVFTSPAVASSSVFFGDQNGLCYALDATDGTEKWRFTSGSTVTAAPAVKESHGLVYFGTENGEVFAVETESGNRQWSFTTADVINGALTLSGGTLYVASSDGTLHARDAVTGDELWTFSGDIGFNAAPVVNTFTTPSTVYCGSDVVHALSADDGRELWNFEVSGTGLVGMAYGTDDPGLYVSSGENGASGTVYKLDSNGTVVWEYGMSDQARSPAVANGTVYVGSQNQTLYALATEDGAVRWRQTFDSRVQITPVVTDSKLYLKSQSRRTDNGELVREFRYGNEFATPAVVDDILVTGQAEIVAYR